MWSAIASVLLGVLGWGATSFFAKPLVDFLNLKKLVHEEITFTANIGAMVADTRAEAFDNGVDALRRLGAKIQATAETDSAVLRWFLSRRGYDLTKTSHGLIGLSNSLHSDDGSRALHTNSIQVGLKLRRSYTDDVLKGVVARMSGKQA
jgi:hypothetical protein